MPKGSIVAGLSPIVLHCNTVIQEQNRRTVFQKSKAPVILRVIGAVRRRCSRRIFAPIPVLYQVLLRRSFDSLTLAQDDKIFEICQPVRRFPLFLKMMTLLPWGSCQRKLTERVPHQSGRTYGKQLSIFNYHCRYGQQHCQDTLFCLLFPKSKGRQGCRSHQGQRRVQHRIGGCFHSP